jgi:hypothetical protein
MTDGLWLFSTLPIWYFATLLNPLAASWLSLVPASGAVCLLVGLVLALYRRERNALWALLPFALSHIFVFITGTMRGAAAGITPLLVLFVVVQVPLSVWILIRCRGSRVAGLFLCWFSLTYAALAYLVGAMSFTDTWL